ncbi:MAG: 3'-5' exoribonuclease YhaM family protein [Acidobacteriaceae bacterium]
MKDFFVADAANRRGRFFRSHFLAAAKQLRDRNDGKAKYLCITLCDRSGRIEARVWDNVDEIAARFESDDFVDAEVCVEEFNGKLQLRVKDLWRLAPEQIDLGDFQRKTTRDIDALWGQLRGAVASFTDADLLRLVLAFLEDPEIARRYKAAPAAKFMHHAWIGGLLEHVVDLIQFCDLAAGHFPLIHRDLLLTGAILHDVGKIYELSWERGFDYTLEGQLIGHISIATRLLDEKVKGLPDFPKAMHTLVEHMVLSHHGSLEFGSPKLPMIPEAVLLHYLDDAEAKMLAMQEACQPQQAGAAPPVYIDRVRALERPLVNTRQYLKQSAPKGE